MSLRALKRLQTKIGAPLLKVLSPSQTPDECVFRVCVGYTHGMPVLPPGEHTPHKCVFWAGGLGKSLVSAPLNVAG